MSMNMRPCVWTQRREIRAVTVSLSWVSEELHSAGRHVDFCSFKQEWGPCPIT